MLKHPTVSDQLVNFNQPGTMALAASLDYEVESCNPADTSNGPASQGSGSLNLTAGDVQVAVSNVQVYYYKCATPSPILSLSGTIASLDLPGGATLTNVVLNLRKESLQWKGSFRGTAEFEGAVVSSAAEFSSVDGLQALGLAGKQVVLSSQFSFVLKPCILHTTK
jgi:hypothetical protein